MKLEFVPCLLIVFANFASAQAFQDWNPHLSLGSFKFTGSGPPGTQRGLITQPAIMAEAYLEKRDAERSIPAVEVGFVNLKTNLSKYDHWKPFYYGYRHVFKSQLIGPLETLAYISLGAAQTKYVPDESTTADDHRQNFIDAYYHYIAMRPYAVAGIGVGINLWFGVTVRAGLSQRLYHIGGKYRRSNATIVSIGLR